MWGVAASILIASVALSVGEYYLKTRDSALAKRGKEKNEPGVKLLEGLQKAGKLSKKALKK
jgi:hypothetical protein